MENNDLEMLKVFIYLTEFSIFDQPWTTGSPNESADRQGELNNKVVQRLIVCGHFVAL